MQFNGSHILGIIKQKNTKRDATHAERMESVSFLRKYAMLHTEKMRKRLFFVSCFYEKLPVYVGLRTKGSDFLFRGTTMHQESFIFEI